MQTAQAVARNLRKLGTKTKAESSAWFFKTGKGQYGEGDVFVGVTVPEQRALAGNYAELSLSEIAKLLQSKIHECRLTALIILGNQFKWGDAKARARIVRFYLAQTVRINNWDLVDVSASVILGTYLLKEKRNILYKLVRSKNLWERRIAIVATLALIRSGEYEDTLALSEKLFGDREDLIHKAVGWMLREVGKMSRPTLVQFLKTRASHMPRTSLRYAIEHFNKIERDQFLRMK